jgi:hypothetical protein
MPALLDDTASHTPCADFACCKQLLSASEPCRTAESNPTIYAPAICPIRPTILGQEDRLRFDVHKTLHSVYPKDTDSLQLL